MTVEDDRPTYERLVREITRRRQKIEIMSLAYYFISSCFVLDYILIKLYINSLSVTLTRYLEHGIERKVMIPAKSSFSFY